MNCILRLRDSIYPYLKDSSGVKSEPAAMSTREAKGARVDAAATKTTTTYTGDERERKVRPYKCHVQHACSFLHILCNLLRLC